MGNPQLCKAEDFYVLMCQVEFSTLNIAPKPKKIIEDEVRFTVFENLRKSLIHERAKRATFKF